VNVDAAWLMAQFPDLENLVPLAQGGQKTVFAADHPADGAVVLKLIHPGQDLLRIQREIAAVHSVGSHRVPAVIASGTVPSNLGNLIWIREQRISGESIRNLIAAGPVSKDRLLQIAGHSLEVLVAAEKAHIVHRDIKPDNLILDDTGAVWVLDFGLARHLDLVSLTATAQHFGVGTPGYAPPEQFRNKKFEIDARADLFGLGVTIHECATSANPYRDGARDHIEILTRMERAALPMLQLAWDPEQIFARYVATLVQRRRDHRPPTAQEAQTWFEEVADRVA
jgi:eukaryotic-like serine/threonine-protein kinase